MASVRMHSQPADACASVGYIEYTWKAMVMDSHSYLLFFFWIIDISGIVFIGLERDCLIVAVAFVQAECSLFLAPSIRSGYLWFQLLGSIIPVSPHGNEGVLPFWSDLKSTAYLSQDSIENRAEGLELMSHWRGQMTDWVIGTWFCSIDRVILPPLLTLKWIQLMRLKAEIESGLVGERWALEAKAGNRMSKMAEVNHRKEIEQRCFGNGWYFEGVSMVVIIYDRLSALEIWNRNRKA